MFETSLELMRKNIQKTLREFLEYISNLFLHFIFAIINNKCMRDIYLQKKRTEQIISFLLVSFSFVFLLFISVTIAYFSSQKTASGSIALGELNFSIYENQTLSQNVVPGEIFNKQVTLVNSRNSAGTDFSGLCSIYFRFTVGVDEADGVIIPQFINGNDWTVLGNTYYYNHVLSPGQSVNLCDALQFSSGLGNEYQSQTFQIDFAVDAIQAENNAYIELWQNAPQSWKSLITQS